MQYNRLVLYAYLLSMTQPFNSASFLGQQVFNQPSLEQQVAYLLTHLVSLENAYNSANPNNLQNRATIAVNYDARTCTMQLSLALTDAAVEGRLADGMLPYLP